MRRLSGIPLLDDILGGGIPPGLCLIEAESMSGGTSLALSILREESALGNPVVFIDAKAGTGVLQVHEYTGDKGVHLVPSSGESALDSIMYSQLIGVNVCAVDSLDAVTSHVYSLTEVGSDIYRSQYLLLRHAAKHLFLDAQVTGKLIVATADSSLDISPGGGKPTLNTQYYRVIRDAVTSYLSIRLKGLHEIYGKTAWRNIEISVLDPADRTNVLGRVNTRLYQQGLSRPYGLIQKLLKDKVLKRRGGTYYFDGLPIERSTKDMAKRITENYSVWYGRAYEKTSESFTDNT